MCSPSPMDFSGRPPRAAISPKGALPLLEVTGTALPLPPIKTRRARYPFTTNTCDGPSRSFPSASWCNLKGLEFGCQRRDDAPSFPDHGYEPSVVVTGQPQLWTSHSTRVPVPASQALADGHARRTLTLAQTHCQERSRMCSRSRGSLCPCHPSRRKGRASHTANLTSALAILSAELVRNPNASSLQRLNIQHVEGDVHAQVGEHDSVHIFTTRPFTNALPSPADFRESALTKGPTGCTQTSDIQMATVMGPPQKSTTTNAGVPQEPGPNPDPEFTNAVCVGRCSPGRDNATAVPRRDVLVSSQWLPTDPSLTPVGPCSRALTSKRLPRGLETNRPRPE